MKKAILPSLIFIAFAMTNCTKDACVPDKDSKTTTEAKTSSTDTKNQDDRSHTCGSRDGNNSNSGY